MQKLTMPRTKVTLDLGTREGELLDAAILGTYLLNIDEITIHFPDPGDGCANMNHFAEVSQKFIGMSLASSGPTQVTIRNLSNVTKLRIIDIFHQMVEIFLIFFEQIEHRDFAGNNTHQLLQMENRYRMGVHLLIFIIRNQYLKFETGGPSNIQVLEYSIALQALRLIILQVHNLVPFVKGLDLLGLHLCFKSLRDITQ